MATDDAFLLQFWGKTPKAGDPPEAYHPAIYHMLDVAFVAEALLRDGAPRLRRALLHAWDGCDPNALVAWLPFLIATHDLGKISAAFQGQAKDGRTQPQRERLQRAGVAFAGSSGQDIYHAEVSAVWLHDHLARREPGTPRRLIWALRDAMGGHHGRFTQEQIGDMRKRLHATERGATPWATWRDDSYTLLRRLLGPPGDLALLGEPRAIRPATVALTGFIVWCDWMGSNERDFPASVDMPLNEYVTLACQRARQAITQAHLVLDRPPPTYRGFSDLFGDPPRPLQALADTIPAETLHGPLLAVIEAPTGEGKTEAALALARRIATLNGIDEIFFALPTMATGNQMFTRLENFYHRLYGDAGAVRLTHSQSLVVEEDLRRRVALAGDSDQADRAGASTPAAIQWFAGPKKAMLAPFGVGTVDQVELAGLNVRHYMLRLFGLAGKVVVIDEVHAYDAYMSTILAHTLSWLASLGASVILLSATLPAARHRALAAAFLGGLGVGDQVAAADPALYPALALYRATERMQLTCDVFRGEQRFTMRFAPRRSAHEEALHLLELVRDGGAVARLCNRVDDAQEIYRELRALLSADSSVLLHARFPLDQRQRREQRIEALVGKRTVRKPDQSLIIIGTQVLEQSLDYDVDVMVSDFAPIDLLLQRAGRLHRHIAERAGKRPARHAQPVLEVALPLRAEGLPDWGRWAAIYEPYILWRTWEVLCTGGTLAEREVILPRDYRPLIEAVYADQPHIPTESPYAAEMAKAWTTYRRTTDEMGAQARRPLIPDVNGTGAIVETGVLDFDDDEDGRLASRQLARTRLGDRITVVPVYRAGNELALDATGSWQISRDVPPDLDGQKEILGRAVPISDRRIIAAYRAAQEARDPATRHLRWPWGQTPPLLRSIFPLELRSDHTAFVDGRRIYLDSDLGLVIDKEEL